MKFTPGKWELNLPCTDEVVADLGGNDISIARHIKNPADARLIAAAPEMYELLKRTACVLWVGDSRHADLAVKIGTLIAEINGPEE